MSMVINSLRSEDEQLFKRMENNYISLFEKIFFEKLQYKMKYELAPSNDLLMSETDNSDLIYIVRVDYDEFIVGHGEVGHYDEEFHAMSLFEALSVNLKQLSFIERNITLWEWLRDRDYKGIRYNHNYAYL